MYEFEQSKRNNLILYGLRGRPHENADSLRAHVLQLLRDNLNIRREIPVARASRIVTGAWLYTAGPETMKKVQRALFFTKKPFLNKNNSGFKHSLHLCSVTNVKREIFIIVIIIISLFTSKEAFEKVSS